jgi:TM2 domain-containing membrane protein YozV
MTARLRENQIVLLIFVALLSWFVPGAGYFWLKERKRAIIVFTAIAITFWLGIYIGSIGVIDPVLAKSWYAAQIINSPMVALLGHVSAGGNFPVYGKPNEIGQIYTSVSGLLNLLCIVNAVHLAHVRWARQSGG